MRKVLLFLFILSVYIFTSPPTVSTGDSGEFITGAYTLGISHPPGFPLYSITGKIFSYIPVSNIAWRISFSSMVFSLISSILIFLTVFSLTKRFYGSSLASLLFSFSSTVWSQSVISEAYMLNAFFTSFCIYILLKWSEDYNIKYFYLFLFAFFLSLSNHYPLMILSACGYLVYALMHRDKLKPVNFKVVSVLFVISIAVYAYIPIRSNLAPPLNWGIPGSFNGFLSHVFRLQYQTVELSKNISLTDKLLFITNYLKEFYGQFFAFTLLLPFGVCLLYKKNRGLLFSLLVIILSNSLLLILILKFSFNPERVGIVNVYYIPSYIAGSIFIGLGIDQALQMLKRRYFKITAFCLLTILMALNAARTLNLNQRNNFLEYDYINNILSYIEKDSNLFIQQAGDESLFGVLYAKEAIGKRNDVNFYDCYGNVNNVYGKGFSLINEKGKWHEIRSKKEEGLIFSNEAPSYYLTFTPDDIPLIFNRNFKFERYGLFMKAMKNEAAIDSPYNNAFELYSLRNTNANYSDYQEREITGFYNYLLGLKTKDYRYFEKACIQSGDVSWIINNAGLFMLRAGDFEKSKKYFDKVISLYPENLAARHNLGIAMKNTGDYESAKIYFEDCIKADPFLDFESYKELAETYILLKNRDKANRIFSDILRGNVKFANEYFYEGARLYKEGKINEAITAWQKASLINPDFALIHYNLGVACMDAGHYGKALINFQVFLDKEKTGKTAGMVRKHLKDIKDKAN